MLCAVVQHVATLAQRLEVRGPVVGRVVIEVRASQDHTRRLNGTCPEPKRQQLRWSPPLPITPLLGVAIPPAAIA